MASDFLKQLIALLAQSGGSASISLTDLQQLGVELTITDIGSPDSLLRLRLGPKIYYVPEKAAEETWPTIPTQPAKLQSKLDAEIDAINRVNNRPRLPHQQVNPEELPPSPQPAKPPLPESAPIALPPPFLHPSPARVIPKTDMDLFLREQQVVKQKELVQARKDQAARRAGWEYPWETRKSPPPKLQ